VKLETDLRRGLTASLVTETLANYEHADEPLLCISGLVQQCEEVASRDHYYFRSDGHFWSTSGTLPEGAQIELRDAVVTEWVARVPGLYWQQGAGFRRTPRQAQIEEQVGNFVKLKPIGKSEVVSGGIGTLRFPPSEAGYRLGSLTTARNASSGVPFLISPDVWNAHNLGEGSLVSGRLTWRRLPIEWSSKFPSVAGIPRNCLVATKPIEVHAYDRKVAVEVHPFAVMEYETNEAFLHDFVFATAQTCDSTMRSAIATFFEHYRKAEGRHGTYLTAGDIAEPMWEATFPSPEDLRKAEPLALRLIEARLHDVICGEESVEAAIRQLSRFEPSDLRRIAVAAELNANRIDLKGPSAKLALRIVEASLQRDRLPALLRIIQEEAL